MKLQVLQENFSKALSLASRFASTKAQLPVLENILLSTEKTKLLVSATNLETSVSISVGAKIEKEGKITIPAKTISDLVSNLNSETLSLFSEKEQLQIASSGFKSSISGMNASDFPSIPTKIDTNSLKIPTEDFLSSLSKVIYAASTDETRPVLTGILFLFEEGRITLVATDGFRLSQSNLKIKGKVKQKRLILPRLSLSELARFSKQYENLSLYYSEEDSQVVFGFPDVVFSSRVLEGEFPDFEKIIPKSSKIKVETDKEDVLKAVKLAAVFARDSANIIKLSIDKNGILVSAESARSGNQETKVDAKVESQETLKDAFEISFNYRFIEDFLNAVEGESVTFEFSETTSPGVFLDSKDKTFLHLIMPVRIQN